MRRATGFSLPVLAGAAPQPGDVVLSLEGGAGLGDEGYELEVTPGGVGLCAHGPAGLFRGTQTLRQLLPPEVRIVVHRPRQPGGTVAPA